MIRTKSRKHVRARGIVQGVGFRPFVYSLALRHGLGGFVGNDTQGVFIEIEGEPEALTAFLNELKTAAPPAARIERIEVTDAAPSGERQFRIVESLDAGGCETSIPPDLALCEECRAEMLDPANRRYRYPFINCTNCGPRFTIVTAIPYDRPNTTMARFGMCRRCRAEYENPADRRYHAQPIACPVCGPHAELCDPQGTAVEVDDPVQEAAVLLRQGKILAIKGLGGFHLACDAASEAAVLRLRERKHRPRRPLAVMAASLEEAGKIVEISPTEMQVLSGIERPIVLLPKCGSSCLAEAVAPGLDVIGVMLPYTPLHELLCRDAGISLVMTSGNLSDEPLCTGNEEALGRLCGIADWFLLHNRDIARPCDDSVVRLWRSGLQFIRRSRGYVPGELPLPRDCGKSILALGGDLKNASCLTKAGRATLSQHLGDLELTVSQEHAAKTRRDLQKLVDANPTLLVRDRHPDYVSRRLAHEAASELAGNAPPLPIHEIQHHHAHLASCLADNRRMEEVYGLTWDGTGYGDDGAIWGGEILLGDMSQYRRVAHLEYIPLVGGGRAVKEPWRVALAWLCRAMPEKAPELARQFFHAIPRERLSLVAEALNHESQTAPCCSMGRLFDAVAALAGIAECVTYEGEAAIMLEQAARKSPAVAAYNIDFLDIDDVLQWNIQTLIRQVTDDRLGGRPIPGIAQAFHQAVIETARTAIRQLSQRWGKKPVALTGGCFQNLTLLEGIAAGLEEDGVEVLTHRNAPCNDGGISYGQAAVASECEWKIEASSLKR